MKRASEFAKEYLAALRTVIGRLPLAELDRIAAAVEAAHAEGRHIFIIGNGGSAATASHLMTDLSKCTLGHKGDGRWRRLRVLALTDNAALMTAWANDTSYRRVFSEPLKNLARRGDVLIAISASGNSPNIIAAARLARKMGMVVLGLGGFGGGKLARLCDVCFVVPSDEYGPVEDVHMMLDHILTGYLYQKLKALHAK